MKNPMSPRSLPNPLDYNWFNRDLNRSSAQELALAKHAGIFLSSGPVLALVQAALIGGEGETLIQWICNARESLKHAPIAWAAAWALAVAAHQEVGAS